MSVFVGVPSPDGRMLADSEDSLRRMMIYCHGQGVHVDYANVPGALITHNRCNIVKIARERGAKYVFMWDADMFVKDETMLYRYIQEAEKDAGGKFVLSGLCVTRPAPHRPTAYYKKSDGLYTSMADITEGWRSVDGVGMACVLIPMALFDAIEKPYYAEPVLGETTLGEDLYFCEKAKAVGATILVDQDTEIGHMGYFAYSLRHSSYIPDDVRERWIARREQG